MDFTVFTDESGSFSNPSGPLGKHVTVALVLPGRRSALEPRIRGALRAASTTLPFPFHATETCHLPNVVAELKKQLSAGMTPCSPAVGTALRGASLEEVLSWEEVPSMRPVSREVRQIASLWLAAARSTAAAFVSGGGMLVVCLQHGKPPEPDQWTRMMFALLQQALILVALGSPGQDHNVEWAIADRAGRLPFDLGETLGALAAARSRGEPFARINSKRYVHLENAEDCPGIWLADAIAHAVGPGASQYQHVSTEDAAALTWLALRQEAATALGTPATALFHPVGARPETRDMVMRATLSPCDPRAALLSALEHCVLDLPPFTYACSVEGSVDIVRRVTDS